MDTVKNRNSLAIKITDLYKNFPNAKNVIIILLFLKKNIYDHIQGAGPLKLPFK